MQFPSQFKFWKLMTEKERIFNKSHLYHDWVQKEKTFFPEKLYWINNQFRKIHQRNNLLEIFYRHSQMQAFYSSWKKRLSFGLVEKDFWWSYHWTPKLTVPGCRVMRRCSSLGNLPERKKQFSHLGNYTFFRSKLVKKVFVLNRLFTWQN